MSQKHFNTGEGMHSIKTKPVVRKEISELSLLFEISQILDSSIDLGSAIPPVLKAITRYTGIERGAITLLNKKTGEISIEYAVGLSEKQQKKGRYKLGEGIIGKVVKTGRPVVVPRISFEPQFLDKTGVRKNSNPDDTSFLCVPIKLENKVIGTLSGDRKIADPAILEENVRLFSIISSMISKAVKLRQEAQEEQQRLLEENIRLQEELKNRFRPSNIIGNSNEMQEVLNLIPRVAKSDTKVLIRGENDTGKELIANAIHYNSNRANKPFFKVNCAALPVMKENRFREDLYYRLNVFPIHIPPLRERKTAILLLADYFIEKYSRENHKNIRRISTSAIDMLMAYHWPGNVAFILIALRPNKISYKNVLFFDMKKFSIVRIISKYLFHNKSGGQHLWIPAVLNLF